MRIAIVAPYFHPVRGGRERTVLELAKGLARRGHSVKVFTTDRTPSGGRIRRASVERMQFTERARIECGNAQIGRGVVESEVEIERIKSVFVAFRIEIPLKIPDFSQFDVVHVISTDDLFTFILAIAAKIAGKRIVATVFTPLALLRHPRRILRPFLALIELLSLVLMLISDVIQVKNEVDFELVRRIKRNVALIPDGIPNYYFNFVPNEDFRAKYGLEDKKIILFVNRIHPLKGPQLLVEAMPEVLKAYPNAVAVFVGSGERGFVSELKRIAERKGVSENALFLGFVSEEEKISAYDSADVVVIPSIGEFTEAFSIVLSEAWARGKTVVVTPSRALRSRVKPGTGYIADYSAESIAENIVKALEHPTRPPKVHSWDEVVEECEKLYFQEQENGEREYGIEV